MRESVIEGYLAELARKYHGVALKLGGNGWPDRLVLLPGGRAGFAELKRPGERARPLQEARLAVLRELGFIAECIDSLQGVRDFFARLVQ